MTKVPSWSYTRCRAILLKAVLNFDQPQSQDHTWLMFSLKKMNKLSTKSWHSGDTGGPQPRLVWGMAWKEAPPLLVESKARLSKPAWLHNWVTVKEVEQPKVTPFWKNLTPRKVLNIFWKIKCHVCKDPKNSWDLVVQLNCKLSAISGNTTDLCFLVLEFWSGLSFEDSEGEVRWFIITDSVQRVGTLQSSPFWLRPELPVTKDHPSL